MNRTYDSTPLTVREIEYSIQIRDKESSFAELRDVLRTELTRYDEHGRPRRQEAENTIQEFIRINIERSILIRENTRIYFLNYKERDGSLKIDFTLLVITSYVNFGPIRQALDNLVKDTIAAYFEELLERHFAVSITVLANDKEVFTVLDNYPSDKILARSRKDNLSRVLSALALIFSLAIILFFTLRTLDIRIRKDRPLKNQESIEMLIDKKINEAVEVQKKLAVPQAQKDSADILKNKPAPSSEE